VQWRISLQRCNYKKSRLSALYFRSRRAGMTLRKVMPHGRTRSTRITGCPPVDYR
jgi:hypothetical protein